MSVLLMKIASLLIHVVFRKVDNDHIACLVTCLGCFSWTVALDLISCNSLA